jgi:hypothetical protein
MVVHIFPYAAVLGRYYFAHKHSKGKLEMDTWVSEVQGVASVKIRVNLDINQKKIKKQLVRLGLRSV